MKDTNAMIRSFGNCAVEIRSLSSDDKACVISALVALFAPDDLEGARRFANRIGTQAHAVFASALREGQTQPEAEASDLPARGKKR